MASINLKGREIPLIYTTYEMKLIQEEIAPLGKFQYAIYGRNPDDDKDDTLFGGPEQLDAVAKLVRILGNAGLEEAGEAPDLTDKKVLRAIRPSEIVQAINACMTAINEGVASEIPETQSDEPVDVTLMELKKKETKES